jgi:hypothetical protein
MNCQQAQDLLCEYSAGILSGQVESDLLAHLGECAVCERERRRLDYMLAALDRLPRPEPPPALWSGLRARLDLERAVRDGVTVVPVRKPAPVGWVPALLTAAAGFLVTIGLMNAGVSRRDATAVGAVPPPATVSVAATNSVNATLPSLDTTAVTVMDSFAMRPVEPDAVSRPHRIRLDESGPLPGSVEP